MSSSLKALSLHSSHSTNFTPESCIFAKCNVDEARDVASVPRHFELAKLHSALCCASVPLIAVLRRLCESTACEIQFPMAALPWCTFFVHADVLTFACCIFHCRPTFKIFKQRKEVVRRLLGRKPVEIVEIIRPFLEEIGSHAFDWVATGIGFRLSWRSAVAADASWARGTTRGQERLKITSPRIPDELKQIE